MNIKDKINEIDLMIDNALHFAGGGNALDIKKMWHARIQLSSLEIMANGCKDDASIIYIEGTLEALVEFIASAFESKGNYLYFCELCEDGRIDAVPQMPRKLDGSFVDIMENPNETYN